VVVSVGDTTVRLRALLRGSRQCDTRAQIPRPTVDNRSCGLHARMTNLEVHHDSSAATRGKLHTTSDNRASFPKRLMSTMSSMFCAHPRALVEEVGRLPSASFHHKAHVLRRERDPIESRYLRKSCPSRESSLPDKDVQPPE
jgi:hypothetical protein